MYEKILRYMEDCAAGNSPNSDIILLVARFGDLMESYSNKLEKCQEQLHFKQVAIQVNLNSDGGESVVLNR